MLIHFDSTAIHIYDVKEEFKTETVLLKANGIFLNFVNEPIRVHLQVYVPKANSNWHVTNMFSPDAVVEISGTVTDVRENGISISIQFYNQKYYNAFLSILIHHTIYYTHVDKRIQMQHFLESTHINATRPYLASGNWDHKINNPTTKQHDNIYCQYVSGSGLSAKLAELDIMVRHNVNKKNLYDRKNWARKYS